MDDNCGEWGKSMGVPSGCCCKEVYIDFIIILLIPTQLVLAFFAASSLPLCSFLNAFCFCLCYFCAI